MKGSEYCRLSHLALSLVIYYGMRRSAFRERERESTSTHSHSIVSSSMAPPIRFSPIPCFCFCFCFCSLLLLLSLSEAYLPLPLRDLPLRSGPNVHDLLTKYGLPKGILPNNVKSYALSDDGSFRVELQNPCYVQFDRLVYYDKVITGKLSYGSVSDVSGIQAKQLFIWLPVTGIKANEKSATVQFYVGPLSEELPAGQFEDIPSCKRQACRGKPIHPQPQAM